MKCKGAFMACLILFSFAVAFFDHHETVHAFSNQVIQRGATGDDVIELQARLQYNGFYNGKIDGVYGWTTYWAVRNFQEKFGMKPVDGLVGAKTKQVLISKSKYYREYVMEQIQKREYVHSLWQRPIEKPNKTESRNAEAGGNE